MGPRKEVGALRGCASANRKEIGGDVRPDWKGRETTQGKKKTKGVRETGIRRGAPIRERGRDIMGEGEAARRREAP